MRHRLFIDADQRSGERVRFTDAQWHQLRSVLRLRESDTVRVFDGIEPVDLVVRLSGHAIGIAEAQLPQASEPRTRLVVYPALLRRDKFETVLQKLTEIGAAAIVPVITARSLVRDVPDDRRRERWRAIMREATEQSCRGVVPELASALTFEAAIHTAEGIRIVAYEGEPRHDVRAALRSRPSTVSLFVGPEGGFETAEARCAREAGAQLVTLGPRILRTETASPVLAALVLYELGDLSSEHGG
jgi:16S rRNA (uracil1498-N3)-methyltransferase